MKLKRTSTRTFVFILIRCVKTDPRRTSIFARIVSAQTQCRTRTTPVPRKNKLVRVFVGDCRHQRHHTIASKQRDESTIIQRLRPVLSRCARDQPRKQHLQHLTNLPILSNLPNLSDLPNEPLQPSHSPQPSQGRPEWPRVLEKPTARSVSYNRRPVAPNASRSPGCT